MGVPVIGTVMKKVFGTRNDRMVKRYLRVVDDVNAFENDIRQLNDAELRARVEKLREQLTGGASADELTPEIFAVGREAMDRSVGIRNIFNPELNFDASRLPDAARRMYEDVQKKIAETEPAKPEGEFKGSHTEVPSWMFVDIPRELYGAVRELYPESKPPFRARPFDVQIIGAIVLSEGRIAEMKTGEGKTIVAPLAALLAVLQGKQVHVVTVNDYLVQRDRDWTFPFFRALGLTVGAIHPMHMQSPMEKKTAYDCDVVYGTTAEFGFDYLRDNMKMSVQEQVQKKRHFAIVDEVDSVLIDEARTPLIISGPAHQNQPRYDLADRLARELVQRQKDWNVADQKVQSCLVEISGLEGDIRNARDKSKVPDLKKRLDEANARLPQLEAERDKFTQYYEVEMDKKRATLTHDGIAEAQKIAGVGSFYVGDNIDIPHLLEQSIRAHTVYQRDRDYVVAPDGDSGEMGVVIVDQNTGRKMVGRQWSDGLHQAVEAKEGVKIKEETQTMATITIQNFFKLYGRLAGMTGTADTEATEFHEIYRLDVICIPTNVPIARNDYQDRIFLSQKDKWNAIVDEIKAFHDAGRPILVGTTSVEKSEHLSDLLTRRHNIQHEVLNAKQHEREANIITSAGRLGAVTISTNMAGRGTDIRLGPVTKESLIDHWKRRGICPKHVTPDMDEDAIIAAVYRHMAPRELDLKKGEVEAMSDEDVRLALLRHWATNHTALGEKKVNSMDAASLAAALDEGGSFLLHRLRIFRTVEDLGGLHVIGTERHEARRIDNQLRGRSGRQGDNGSSRFFLSLEDDLMKMFAGETTLKLLSRLGMKEGDSIEHPMLSRSVERAQRKVEERNFLWRKNILEYDEIMDVQRGIFYGLRQEVLEGRDIKRLIFEYIEESVNDAVSNYLNPNYAANCVNEWVNENLGVHIDSDRIRKKDRDDVYKIIQTDAKEESAEMIRVTLGEYLSLDTDPSEWDWKGLADWANTRFKANVKMTELRELDRAAIARRLEAAAEKLIDETDLAPIDQYLVPNYGAKELAQWANNKFGTDFKIEDFQLDPHHPDLERVVEIVMDRAKKAYREREVTYPVDFALEMTAANMQQDPQRALSQFAFWAKMKFGVEWKLEDLTNRQPKEIRAELIEAARKWDDDRIDKRANEAVAAGRSPESLEKWFNENYASRLTEEELAEAAEDPFAVARNKIQQIIRSELTQLERWVLLQILDQAWKDHLYSMDQVKDSIGLRAFSQRDPRIEFKQEGARLFNKMQGSIRDRVTDLVFKARLSAQPPQQQQRPMQRPVQSPAVQGAQQQQQQQQEQRAEQPAPPRPISPAQPATTAAAAAMAGMAAQKQRDLEAAQQAGAPGGKGAQKPRRVGPAVGRNEPCPCGSGKKFKQCCGAR